MKNGKNGLMSYEQLRELLQMTALQTTENYKQIAKFSKEFKADLVKSHNVHNREMKQIRAEHKKGMADIRSEMKKMIKRISY